MMLLLAGCGGVEESGNDNPTRDKATCKNACEHLYYDCDVEITDPDGASLSLSGCSDFCVEELAGEADVKCLAEAACNDIERCFDEDPTPDPDPDPVPDPDEDECDSDSDCNGDEICSSGSCQDVECKYDSDCGSCSRCSSHSCRSCGYGPYGCYC